MLNGEGVNKLLGLSDDTLCAYDGNMNPLVFYATTSCPYCWELRQYLAELNLPFVEKRVDSSEEAARELQQLVGDQVVPVVARPGETSMVVIGFDKQRLALLVQEAV